MEADEPIGAPPGQAGAKHASAVERVDIVIRDVGGAVPRAASVLAELFSLPVEAIVAAIYRAPARLVAGLEPEAARWLMSSLAFLKLNLDLAPTGEVIALAPGIDLAAEIEDPALVDGAADALAEFLGIESAAALELLMTAPGVIMGNVSRATVDALAQRLPPGALKLLAADPAESRYALFAGDLAAKDRLAVEAVIGARPSADGGGLVALDLSHAEANRLWRALAGIAGVRLVNQSFLRFEIVLNEIVRSGDETAAALEAFAGVPRDHFAELARLLPVVIEEDLPQDAIEERLAAYAAHGMTASARLATFAEHVLVVDAAPAEALASLGYETGADLPLRLPPLPARRARLLRHRLEAAGAEVSQFPVESLA